MYNRNPDKYYQSETPCSRGHLAPRYKTTRQCSECLRDWRREDARKNRERVYRYQRENKERIAGAAEVWKLNNLDRVNSAKRKYRENNHVKMLKQGSEWRKRNRDYGNAKKMEREARKILATPVWVDKGKILEMYEAAQAATEIFETPIHVDHIVPLRSKYVCGLHCEANLRLLPGLDNQRKSNRVWPDMPDSLVA